MRPTWKTAPVDAQGLDLVEGFVPRVSSMEVRWSLITIINVDNNSKEAADTRHSLLAYLINFQTFSGLTGISRRFPPYGDSASTIALTIAGVAPIVPASPTPLTPSGFTGEGVSVRSVSNHGTCEAFGSA